MSDRAPIGTIVGLLSGWTSTDFLVVPVDGVPKTITRVLLRRTDNGSGDVVTASIRNATGGGGSGIDITLGDGVSENSATGTLAASATEAVYLRLTAADSNSQNLTGWIEIEGAAGLTTERHDDQHRDPERVGQRCQRVHRQSIPDCGSDAQGVTGQF